MNLSKLFDAQKKLRERINYNGEDRFEKLILALLVEIGELCQEWRGFKFWSQDQEPRTENLIPCDDCKGSGYSTYHGYCGSCHGGYVGKTNPLLEEYVDGLHFILEVGIELGYENVRIKTHLNKYRYKSITQQFIYIQQTASKLIDEDHYDYIDLTNYYLVLGEMLGFTWEQIEQAYFDKNQINHSRQENGY